MQNMKNKNNFSYLVQKEQTLKNEMKQLIISAIKDNGGRIKFFYSEDDLEDVEFPIVSTLNGKYSNPNICITDVYLGIFDNIYADGIDQQHYNKETELLILPEQYSDIVHFISVVLGWNNPLQYKNGDLVYWLDPDNGKSSGVYKILDNRIDAIEKKEDWLKHFVLIGYENSVAEVPVTELYAVSDEQMLMYHFSVGKTECKRCNYWRELFADRKGYDNTFCPDCGKLLTIHYDESIEFEDENYPARIIETVDEYKGYKIATEEFYAVLFRNGEHVSDIAEKIDEDIWFYVPEYMLALDETALVNYVLSQI